MADNLSLQSVVPATLPDLSPLATKQLADGSHAGLVVLIDPADRTKLPTLPSSNAVSSQVDGHSVTHGAKGDAAWDGAALSPSSQGVWKYIGIKIEAVRALLAGTLAVSGTFFQATQPTTTVDGGNTTFGAQANPAWDGVTGSATAIAIFKAIWAKLAQMYVAMTDVTAISITNRRRDTTGRQVAYVCNFILTGTADAVLNTFTKYTDGVASGAGALTSLTTPAPYRLALTGWSIGGTNNAGMTTATQLRASLRHQTQAAATLASPFVDQIATNTGPTANAMLNPVRATFQEPIEFLAGDSIAVSIAASVWANPTTNPVPTIILNGREYLNP